MVTSDIETDNRRLTAFGENASISRKGKKIKISAEETFIDGDSIVCGERSVVSIDISYNSVKNSDDYKSRVSKTIYIGPNSELHVKDIRDIELKKGFFYVSYLHTEDVLKTPAALIKFNFSGSGFFDVYNDSVYSCTIPSTSVGAGGIEYMNKLTKGSFVAKASVSEEIIVTRDGIYKRPGTKMDDIFQNNVQLLSYFTNKHYATIPTTDSKKMAEQYKNMPKQTEEGLGGIEMMKNMTPADIERMMKMSEAHGAKITPEQMKMMRELPEKLKQMEKSGVLGKMKKGMAMQKGMMEGLGDAGIERLAKAQTEGMEQMKKIAGKVTGVEALIESPRRYKPLTDAKKVA